MNKETLGQYGWVVICVIVLAIMITFATPFGNKIAGEVVETVTNMTSSANTALDEISVGGYDGGVGGGAGGGTEVKLINFTVDGVSYQAKEGMTWEQWIGSDYDPSSFDCADHGVHSAFVSANNNEVAVYLSGATSCSNDPPCLLHKTPYENDYVKLSEEIESGYEYLI